MKYYFDVDGPITDFAAWMVSEGIPLGYDRADTESMFHERVDDVFIEAPSSKYCESIYQMYTALKECGHEVYLLTAIGDHWPSSEMKGQASYNKLLSIGERGFDVNDVIIVDSGSDKIKYADNKSMLFDDKWSTIKKWEKAGGLGMYVPEAGLLHDHEGIKGHTPEG